MDDILKRMLLVEQQADEIVCKASDEASAILEESRQKANQIAADEQLNLAAEVDRLVKERLDKAEADKTSELQNQDIQIKQKAEEFSKSIAVHEAEIVEALLYTR